LTLSRPCIVMAVLRRHL